MSLSYKLGDKLIYVNWKIKSITKKRKKKKSEDMGDYLFSQQAALQQVSWLVILQIADAGISSFAQQQLQDHLLVEVTMETGCHV